MYIIYLNSYSRSGRRPHKFRRIDFLRRYLINLHFNRLIKDTGVHCILDTYKNEEIFIDITVFLYYTATAHNYDLKIGSRYLERRYRIYSIDVPLVNDLTIDLTTDSITDSTTDKTIDETTNETMSDIQTSASSVDSDVLLNINPRLLADQVETEKSEEARISIYLTIRAKIVPLHESFGMESTDKDLENQ